MRWLAALLLVVGSPALAAAPVVSLGGNSLDRPFAKARTVRVTFNPGDSGDSTAIPNFCTHWVGEFQSDGDAGITIHAGTALNFVPGAGNQILAATEDRRIGPASPGQPFLKVRITNATTGGRLVMACVQTATYYRPWYVGDSPGPCAAETNGAAYYDVSLRTVCTCVDDGTPAWETIDRAIADTPTALSCG